MPGWWNRKDETIYKKIAGAYRKRGRSLKISKEIAARTVNKLRRVKAEARSARAS